MPAGSRQQRRESVAHTARVVIGLQVQAFVKRRTAASRGDIEGVHELRVATRRLRGSLRLFSPMLPAPFVAAARRDIGWLADRIGDVRDLDVTIEIVKSRATHLDPVARKALAQVLEWLRMQRKQALPVMVASLRSERARLAITQIRDFTLSSRSSQHGRGRNKVPPSLLRPLLRGVMSMASHVDRDASPDVLHKVRVRIKRLRYALETTDSLGGKTSAKTLRTLRRAQERLGEYHDVCMVMSRVRDYCRTPNVTAMILFTMGALHEDLSRHALRIRRRVPGVLRDVLDRASRE